MVEVRKTIYIKSAVKAKATGDIRGQGVLL